MADPVVPKTQPAAKPEPTVIQAPAAPQPVPPVKEPPKPASSNMLAPLLIILILAVLGVAAYFLRSRQAKPLVQETITVPSPAEAALFLDITSPGPETSAANGEILVSGKTLPNTTVIIYTDTDENSLESDAQGKFESSVVVGDKGGLVRITAYSGSGDELTKTFDVKAK